MIKANKAKATATSELSDENIAQLGAFISKLSDTKRLQKELELNDLVLCAKNEEGRALSYESDAVDHHEQAESYQHDADEIESELRKMPALPPKSADEVKKEIVYLTALSWIASVEVISRDGANWLKVMTRPDALYTTLNSRISEGFHNWYRVRPYKIALPAYEIQLALVPFSTVCNNTKALVIKLADYEKDTAYFMRCTGSMHDPHAHWATRHKENDV